MRTTLKAGKPSTGNPKNGSALPRTTRRTAIPQNTVTEQSIPVLDETIEAQIARLAYFLWETRGGIGGSSEEDWLRAEQEILTRSRT